VPSALPINARATVEASIATLPTDNATATAAQPAAASSPRMATARRIGRAGAKRGAVDEVDGADMEERMRGVVPCFGGGTIIGPPLRGSSRPTAAMSFARTNAYNQHFGRTICGDRRSAMSKAFTREADTIDDDEREAGSPLPAGARNYLTPGGFERMKAELERLVQRERPELVATVAWAAGNGDRSENGDYIYGKKRLREIDRRIRFLIKRLDIAEVVDPAARRDDDASNQIFFGATVTIRNAKGEERTLSIVGVDEIDTGRGYVSWVSPVARALLKAREGDTVTLKTPGGVEELDILAVRYLPLATGDVPADGAG
jgi:transcription elongation factor GreB